MRFTGVSKWLAAKDCYLDFAFILYLPLDHIEQMGFVIGPNLSMWNAGETVVLSGGLATTNVVTYA